VVAVIFPVGEEEAAGDEKPSPKLLRGPILPLRCSP
jgi:hypothetical protein